MSNERETRYAEAIAASDGDMQAEVDRLGERVAYYRDSEVPALRSNADGWAARADAAEARLDALVADLRGLLPDRDYGESVDVWLSVKVADIRAILDKHAGEQ